MTPYAPDEITETYIENIVDDLKCELLNILENDDAEFKEEAYDNAIELLNHIERMADELCE